MWIWAIIAANLIAGILMFPSWISPASFLIAGVLIGMQVMEGLADKALKDVGA